MLNLYGMRIRPAGLGTIPKEGFLGKVKYDTLEEYNKENKTTFLDLVVYDRKLSEEEVKDYQMNNLGQISEELFKDIRY